MEEGTNHEKRKARYDFDKQRREIGKGIGLKFIFDMLESFEIDRFEEEYSVEEYLPKIQKYLTAKYPDEGSKILIVL